MGHRTQIVNIIRTDLECLQGEQHLAVQVLHNHWGYGKVMPLALMSKLNQLYSADIDYPFLCKNGDELKKAVIDYIPTLNHLSFFDVKGSNYNEILQDQDERKGDFIKECVKPLLSTSWDDLTQLAGKFLDWLDNNDGILFVVQTYKKGQHGLDLDICTFFYHYNYIDTGDKSVMSSTILDLESYVSASKGDGEYLDKALDMTKDAFLSLKPLYQDCHGKGLEILDIVDDDNPDSLVFPTEFK